MRGIGFPDRVVSEIEFLKLLLNPKEMLLVPGREHHSSRVRWEVSWRAFTSRMNHLRGQGAERQI